MRRYQPGAAVHERNDEWGDETVVDFAAPDRARRDFISVHDAETVARPLPFDDLPTTIWTPHPRKMSLGTSPEPVSTRRLRSVETGPKVQIEEAPEAWSDRDEVTRIEVLAAPKPLPAEETTAPGKTGPRAKARRRFKLACVAGIALVAVACAFGWQDRHPRALPVPVAAPPHVAAPVVPRAPAPAASLAPVAASVPMTSPAVAAAAVSPATGPAVQGAGGGTESAAIDAVEAGELRRAARIYAALAAANPGNEAYREAARILFEGTKEARQ
jgi:hypothetical protein